MPKKIVTARAGKACNYNAGDVREVIALSMTALMDGELKTNQANFLNNCAGDYTTLIRLQLKLLNKLGTEIITGVPDIRPLHDLLECGEWTAAIQKAKQIRAAMATILKQTREKLKEP